MHFHSGKFMQLHRRACHNYMHASARAADNDEHLAVECTPLDADIENVIGERKTDPKSLSASYLTCNNIPFDCSCSGNVHLLAPTYTIVVLGCGCYLLHQPWHVTYLLSPATCQYICLIKTYSLSQLHRAAQDSIEYINFALENAHSTKNI